MRTRTQLPYPQPIHIRQNFLAHKINVPVDRHDVVQKITGEFEHGTPDLEPPIYFWAIACPVPPINDFVRMGDGDNYQAKLPDHVLSETARKYGRLAPNVSENVRSLILLSQITV